MKTLLALVALSLASFAHAGESRFTVDPSVDLDRLAATGEIAVVTSKEAHGYVVDASMVVSVKPGHVKSNALNFESHAQWGMPSIRAARAVRRDYDSVISWVHMSATGVESKHFVLTRGSPSGIEWEMIPGESAWSRGFEESPAFERFDSIR